MWVAILCFLAAGYQLYQRYLNPPPPIPRPADWAALEPFVRAYLAAQVQWVGEAPRDANRRAVLGLAYAANGLWEPAHAAFEDAARLDPKEPLAPLYAAVTLEFGGQREAAVEAYTEVARRFPGFAPATSRLAEALLRLERWDDAAAAFRRLQELEPEEWRGYAGLAEVQLQQGELEAARRSAERAVELNPQAGPAHHLLGMIHQRLGNDELARRELRLGMSPLRPPLADAWSVQVPAHMRREEDLIGLAQSFLRNGQPDRAAALLEAALVHNTNSVPLRTYLGLARQQEGRPDEASQDLETALSLDPDYVPALVGLATTRLIQGDPTAARELADRAIAEEPELHQPHLVRANVALAENRDDDAIASLRKAATLAPNGGQIHMDIGNILFLNQERLDEALEAYRRAVALEPDLLPARVRMAQILVQQGQTNEALGAIRGALERAPGDTNLLALEAALLNPTPPATPDPAPTPTIP